MMFDRRKIGKSKRAGAILIDALIGAALLVLGAVAYYSMTSVTAQSKMLAQQRTAAVEICNRINEQLLLLRPNDLTAKNLYSLNLIDSSTGNSPFSFTKFPMDDGWNLSPSKVLPNGTGTMSVTSLSNGSAMVTLTISWKSVGGVQSYTTGTILGGYR